MKSLRFFSIIFSVLFFFSGCQIIQSPHKTVGQQPGSPTDTDIRMPEPEVEAQITFQPSLPWFARQDFYGDDLTLGPVLDDNEAYTRYYITYTSNGLKISGIMNLPHGPGPFPVLFLNHGFIDPEIYTNGRGLKREQDYLARRGYIVIHSDYRNHADSDKDPDAELNFRLGYAEDVINAVKAVKNSDLTFFDKEHLGMLGHSMGGGIAQTIMVTHPDLVDAYVLFAPVSSDYVDSFRRWIERGRPAGEQIKQRYGSPTQTPEFWSALSPRTYFDQLTGSVLIHHGTADQSVPLEWSEQTVAALEALNKDITFYVYVGEPHEFINAWPLVMARTVDFFDQDLKK